jgi:RNA polymerase sigma-70 factor (ECF subfamily)
MTDDALLAGLAAGGPDVGLAFVRRFQRHVFAVALAVVGDPALAEDVAQQTFERAWRRAASFNSSRGTVRTWLTTISHNLAIDTVRKRKPTPVDPTDLIRLLGPGTDDIEQAAIREDATAQLRAALADLPHEQARAVVMAGVYGMTAHEVAAADGIALGTAKTRIRAAMQKLRVALESTSEVGT